MILLLPCMLPVCWCMRSHSFLPDCFGVSIFGILSCFNCREFSSFFPTPVHFSYLIALAATLCVQCWVAVRKQACHGVCPWQSSFSLECDVSCGLLDNLYCVRKRLWFSGLKNTFFIFMRGMLLDFSVAVLYPLRFSCCPLPFIALIWLCHIEF